MEIENGDFEVEKRMKSKDREEVKKREEVKVERHILKMEKEKKGQ